MNANTYLSSGLYPRSFAFICGHEFSVNYFVLFLALPGLLFSQEITGHERIYMQFRTEVFSLTNTPILKNPTNTVGSSLGKITSASGDRRLQFALKLVF